MLEVDSDESGTIDFPEFLALMSKVFIFAFKSINININLKSININLNLLISMLKAVIDCLLRREIVGCFPSI